MVFAKPYCCRVGVILDENSPNQIFKQKGFNAITQTTE